MAIQNFIGGGFANKLGEMVGYHAKGKWIVRTWVKTPQPNTPDQITNRWRFAHLIFAAQLGLRYSGRQGFLPSDTRSEFQSRSSWAGDRWKLGQQGIGLVYLQPDRPTITTDVSSFIQPSGDGMSARVFHCSFPRSAPSMRGFSAILSWANSLEKDSADVYTGSCADNIWYQAFEISSGFSLKKPWAELVEGELTTLALPPAPGSWSRGYAAPVPVGEPRWIHMGLASAIAWMVEPHSAGGWTRRNYYDYLISRYRAYNNPSLSDQDAQSLADAPQGFVIHTGTRTWADTGEYTSEFDINISAPAQITYYTIMLTVVCTRRDGSFAFFGTESQDHEEDVVDINDTISVNWPDDEDFDHVTACGTVFGYVNGDTPVPDYWTQTFIDHNDMRSRQEKSKDTKQTEKAKKSTKKKAEE